ncbi:hypothetical protein GQS52_23940 [Streptomyces sp. SCUT-3]|uniref:hypothetical protein n=1 Tax=Streptomyces TaxID=1883 RepID=UPI0015FD4502|nr:hypothetical protein [Streptomyces sp. SCUT-3]QMV24321.1 hypothetical protein GQS52_23940 [Streptomyces sp. SCUT-3]
MSADLSPVIAATAQWLVRAYPAAGGALSTALAETQARQAATVAARLLHPTPVDVALLGIVGPGGSARLDRLVGADAGATDGAEHGWRTWVDETVASWAACLLADPALAAAAVAALAEEDADADGVCAPAFRRLTDPDAHDRRAASLLRHPDLLAPVADLHRDGLAERLRTGPAAPAKAA